MSRFLEIVARSPLLFLLRMCHAGVEYPNVYSTLLLNMTFVKRSRSESKSIIVQIMIVLHGLTASCMMF
jgi:hypothetical protein